ncbi:plasmid stability protein [Rhizobium petrolearium]|uniref:FitA-like ribbon-helix-helix domain-containing protein n=1 Tax=Neorhizobium petrolearium TaxID=515361 RepID=UPI001AE7CF6B|nr:plasmid stabilization protein [Neorhizobium petrolearium]MBP1841924.1 plasmid stability protein [Neorhizobium petrolearium]
MGDLLIRNLDDALKQELQERARESGRSLSEEAIVLLRRSLSTPDEDRRPAGEWLRGLLGDAMWTEEELAAIEAARHEPDREPPKFDE